MRPLLRKPLFRRDRHAGLRTHLRHERFPAQVMQDGRQIQSDGQRQGVGKLLGQGQRRLAAGDRLVGVPEEPEARGGHRAATHAGIVPAVERGMGTVALRLIRGATAFGHAQCDTQGDL
jgi:hypothetical protein